MSFRKTLAFLSAIFYVGLRLLAPNWVKHAGHVLTAFYTFFFSLSCLYIYHVLIYPHFLCPLRHIPEPSGASFFTGHFSEIIRKLDGSHFRRWLEETPNDGLIRFRDLFNITQVMPTSSAAIADLLVHRCYDFEKPEMLRRGSTMAILGNGLLFAEGDVHKTQRKSLMPAFSYRHIKDLQPIFWSHSINMIRAIGAQPKAEFSPKGSAKETVFIVEPNEMSSRATLDIIGAAALGHSFESLNDPSNELNNSYRAIARADKTAIFFGILEFLLPIWFVTNLPVPRNRDLKRNIQLVNGVCAEIIEKERKEMERQQNSDQKEARGETSSDKRLHNPSHGRKPQTILTTAISSTHHQFTTKELIGHLTTFLIAGHETTAAALSWSIYNLCKYPEMQKRLRDEVRQVIPTESFQHTQDNLKDTDPDMDSDYGTLPQDLDLTLNLPYLMAFTSEILRLFSPVPATSRQAVRDTMLAGQFIPKGTIIGVPIWGINVDKKLWDSSHSEKKENDVAKFKPERWIESPTHSQTDCEDRQDLGDGAVPRPSSVQGSGGAKSNYANLTFIHGPRSCIGQSFARSELACLLAAWIGYFHIEFDEETNRREMDGQAKLKETRKLKQKQKSKGESASTTDHKEEKEEEIEEELVGIAVDMLNGISAKPGDGYKVVCRVMPW